MHLAQIWRHPIKGIGAEAVAEIRLSPDQGLPLDRAWAVMEEGRDVPDGVWAPCVNFLRGAKAPSLMAVTAAVLADGRLRLSHPDCADDLVFDPDTAFDALVAWLAPIWPEARGGPARLTKAGRAMTDSQSGHVAIMTTASLAALSAAAGQAVDPRRFRGNLWLEGAAPWAEFDWAGQTLQIGEATLEILEPIKRCRAPNGNPANAAEDINMLKLLTAHFEHTHFGMTARVVRGGDIATGAAVSLACA